MNNQNAVVSVEFEQAIQMVINGLNSENSRAMYRKYLTDFLTWRGNRPINKALVQEYKQSLTGLSPSTINVRLSAIRRLASEAADNQMLDQPTADAIRRVQGITKDGVRTGNWLDKRQAQELLMAPQLVRPDGRANVKAYRDRAVLAVMIGAGLRRSEVAALKFDHVQQREGRWTIVDLVGKRNHVRTVPIAAFVKVAIDEWADIAAVHDGLVIRAVKKGGEVTSASISPQAILYIVKSYGDKALGVKNLAPHDLRRTYAKLAHKGGAGLDQIQLSLGHKSIKTTEVYLGVEQDLTDAPGDHLGLTLG